MKKLKIQRWMLGVALLLMVPIAMHTTTVGAQDAGTDEHLEKIRQNCVTAQVTMQRVQQSDLATRINFGRAYDSLMTKLMEPLNSRMVASRATIAPALAEKTTELEVSVETFRDHYVEYTTTLNGAIRTDCQKNPAQFYATTQRSKELRTQLANDIKMLKQVTSSYQKDVSDYAETLENEGQ